MYIHKLNNFRKKRRYSKHRKIQKICIWSIIVISALYIVVYRFIIGFDIAASIHRISVVAWLDTCRFAFEPFVIIFNFYFWDFRQREIYGIDACPSSVYHTLDGWLNDRSRCNRIHKSNFFF
eukprot:NODE_346_length_10492_cov_0.275955.p7 type:complete len:122 gc:universal NODE_346_length_10492_cov_0.275955:3123-2758(-)